MCCSPVPIATAWGGVRMRIQILPYVSPQPKRLWDTHVYCCIEGK